MYQFIVTSRSSGTCVGADTTNWSSAGATVGDISTMSVAGNGTNKWASRAVVALQLAAWSAVGIVLLEKGVTTLQKHPHTPLNVSLEITTPASSRDAPNVRGLDNPARINRLSQHEIDAGLAVVPIDGDGSDDAASDRGAGGVNKSATISPRQRLEQTDDKGTSATANKNSQMSRSNDADGKNSGKNASGSVEDKGRAAEESEQKAAKDWDNEAAAVRGVEDSTRDGTWSSPVTIKVVMDNLDEHRWESRKRLRIARVNAGGGAAAAIAMVAVGAVMLVLGPAVIILRALDERRQERRFLKLSGEEDLPPSYEEATSELDQAPTYSSLNLDTILVTPSNTDEPGDCCANASCTRGGHCCC